MCLLQVDVRCQRNEVRLSNSRRCVPTSYRCEEECTSEGGGRLNVGLGICQCFQYRDPRVICQGDCRTCQPSVKVRNSQSQIFSTVTDCNGTVLAETELFDVFGLSSLDTIEHQVQIVSYDRNGGVGGVFPTSNDEAISEVTRRRGRNSRSKRDVETFEPEVIPNPLICLLAGEAIFFEINEDANSSSYHYPIYIKDHLLNDNPTFDYGPFRRLASLLQSSVNFSTFIYAFEEAGTYVFSDSLVTTSQMIIRVVQEGSSCEREGEDFRVLPASLVYLNAFSIARTETINQEPDFAAISGILATALFIVTLMVLSVFIWKPKSTGVKLPDQVKPKYRRVDEPKIIYVGENPDDLDSLEKRGIGVGSSSIMEATQRRDPDSFLLENFSVKTLYDKLEDQTLHVASQLARQQADLRGFYDCILQQTEGLRDLVSEAQVMSTVERNRKFRAEHSTLAKSALAERGEPVGSDGTASTVPSLPHSHHEQELMSVLKDLLQKVSGLQQISYVLTSMLHSCIIIL